MNDDLSYLLEEVNKLPKNTVITAEVFSNLISKVFSKKEEHEQIMRDAFDDLDHY